MPDSKWACAAWTPKYTGQRVSDQARSRWKLCTLKHRRDLRAKPRLTPANILRIIEKASRRTERQWETEALLRWHDLAVHGIAWMELSPDGRLRRVDPLEVAL